MELPSGGTVDTAFPTSDNPIDPLSEGRCNDLRAMVNAWPRQSSPDDPSGVPDAMVLLYRAAAEVCLADWTHAKPDLDAALKAQGPGPVSCARQNVIDWVKARVAAHDADPTAIVTYTRRTVPGICPTSSLHTGGATELIADGGWSGQRLSI